MKKFFLLALALTSRAPELTAQLPSLFPAHHYLVDTWYPSVGYSGRSGFSIAGFYGIVLNPATSHDAIEYLVEDVDLVLVMTVNPGFGGQAFIPEMLPKIEMIRSMLGDKDLEVDGGIDGETAQDAVRAGANVLVAGSYIYDSPSYLEAIESLKDAGR